MPRSLGSILPELESGVFPRLSLLASSAGTHFDGGERKDAKDPIDRRNCRPDFLILSYAVISMEDGVAHSGSKNNLLGSKPDEKLVQNMSNDKQVTKNTPPTFIFHTSEDTVVLPENAIRFYQACKKAGVPVEMHILRRTPRRGTRPRSQMDRRREVR